MGATSNTTLRFKWTGRVFTDTMLTLPAGCIKPERSLGVCPKCLSASKKRSSHRDIDALLAVLQSEGAPAPAYPTPRLGKGQKMSAGENWALIVFHKHYGGRSSAFLPAEITYMVLHLRSTRTVVCLSLLGMVVWCQVSALEAPGAWTDPAGLLSFPFALASARRLLAQCCHHQCGYGPSLVMVTSRWEAKDGEWQEAPHSFRQMPFPSYMCIMVSPVL